MTGGERRQHPRRPVVLECQVEGVSGLTDMRVTDLSVDGCYVDSRALVGVGSPTTLHLRLSGITLTLTGRIAHSQPGIGFGVRFDRLPSSTAQMLEKILEPPTDGR